MGSQRIVLTVRLRPVKGCPARQRRAFRASGLKGILWGRSGRVFRGSGLKGLLWARRGIC